MNKKSKKRGFTILEVVVAIALFGFLYVGLFNAIFVGTRMLPIVRARIYAKNILNTQCEILRSLPMDHPFLTNDGDNNDLEDTTAPDFARIDTFTITDSLRLLHDIRWNIAENMPEQNMVTIRVYVMRNLGATRVSLWNDVVRWRGE